MSKNMTEKLGTKSPAAALGRGVRKVIAGLAAGGVVVGALALGGVPAEAAPNDAGDAFVWANQPTAAKYAPSSSWAQNPTGGNVEVTRSSKGTYSVAFAGQSLSGGNVQVSAYNSGATCTPTNWSGNRINVACVDANGDRTDTQFSALYTPPGAGDAFAWADRPTAAKYAPSSGWAQNPSGGKVEVTRTSTGSYSVAFAGQSLSGGNVQVSAYGSSATCTPTSWGGDRINVACVDADGDRTDTRFSALYTPNDAGDAFAWANQSTAAKYVPSPSYAQNPSGGKVEVTRTSTGSYSVTFAGQSLSGGNVQVSAYGSGATCTPTGWGGNRINVACVDANGDRTDTRFSALYTPNKADDRFDLDRAKTVRFTIDRLQATSSDSCNGRMDFYSTLKMANGATASRSFGIDEGNDISPSWTLESGVASGVRTVDLNGLIRDEDDTFCGGGDDKVDVHPASNASDLMVRVDLVTGDIRLVDAAGNATEKLGQAGSKISTRGRHGSEHGIVTFTVNVTQR